MPSHCVVPRCNKVGFFTFPKDEKPRRQWKLTVKREDFYKEMNALEVLYVSKICKDHFDARDSVSSQKGFLYYLVFIL